MKRICAWCKSSMGEVQSTIHDGHSVTHGICETCLNMLYSENQIDFIPFLNTINAPVVLIDENNNFRSANTYALSILNKRHVELEGKRTGDVFTCENAGLPGGCGHTKKCGGCQMLGLIKKTFESETSFNNVAVRLNRNDHGMPEELNLQLSTEKVNDLVLMRIDQYNED